MSDNCGTTFENKNSKLKINAYRKVVSISQCYARRITLFKSNNFIFLKTFLSHFKFHNQYLKIGFTYIGVMIFTINFKIDVIINTNFNTVCTGKKKE